MFTNISWVNYIVVVALFLASWYLIIAFRFYFEEIKNLLAGKQKNPFRIHHKILRQIPQLNPCDTSFSKKPQLESEFAIADSTFDDVETLVEQLKNVIADLGNRKPIKREVIDYLRVVLIAYPTIKNSPFTSAVSELIVSECDKFQSIHLTQEEAEDLWN